jgi:hypothetical protein
MLGDRQFKHDGLLLPVRTDWPCRPLPARIMGGSTGVASSAAPTRAHQRTMPLELSISRSRIPSRPKPLPANAAPAAGLRLSTCNLSDASALACLAPVAIGTVRAS